MQPCISTDRRQSSVPLQEEFGEDEDDSDESSDSDSDSDGDVEDGGDAEAELDELNAEAAEAAAGGDEAGPSSGTKRRRSSGPKEGEAEIVDNASGDEVDPGLIISGGRGARRGRGGPSAQRPKYTAAAQLDSDEDEW